MRSWYEKRYPFEGGAAAVTLGYYKPNDGGGALYQIIDATAADFDTLTDDGGSVHDLENDLKAKLIIKDNINVKQFGAYGDGEHDDTNAIQKAINIGVSNNMVTILNEGTFIVSNLEILTEKTHLKGISPEKSILKKKSNTDSLNSVIKIDSNGFNKTKIENITIEGNKSSNTAYGILVENTITKYNNNFTLRNIYVNNCGLDGVNITPEIKTMDVGTEILNARFIGNDKNGINLRGTDLVLKNIIAYLNKESGIKIACNSSKFSNIKCYRNGEGDKITLEDDTRKDSKATGIYYKKYPGMNVESYMSTFSQIDVQENEGDGIYLTGYNNDFNGLNADNNGYLQDGESNPISYTSQNLYPIYDGLHIKDHNMLKIDMIYNNFRFDSVGAQQRSAIGTENCSFIIGQAQGGNQIAPVTKSSDTQYFSVRFNNTLTVDTLPFSQIQLPENVTLDPTSYIKKDGKNAIMHLVIKKSDNFSTNEDTILKILDSDYKTTVNRFCIALLSDNEGWNSHGWGYVNNLMNGEIRIKPVSITANYATIDTIYEVP